MQTPTLEHGKEETWITADGEWTDGSFKCEKSFGRYHIRPIFNEGGSTSWEVCGGDKGDGSWWRKREKRLAKAYKKAKDLDDADKKRVPVNQWLEVPNDWTPELIHDVAIALPILRSLGARLDKIPWTFTNGFEWIKGNYKETIQRKRMSQAREEYIEACKMQGNVLVVRKRKQSILKGLERASNDSYLDEVKEEHVLPIIDRPPDLKSKRANLGVLSHFFEWARREPRQYCPTNPTAAIEIAKGRATINIPKIFSKEEVEDFVVKTIAYKNGRLLPYVTLLFFMGMRPAEIVRLAAAQVYLGWNNIHLEADYIHVFGKGVRLRDAQMRPGIKVILELLLGFGYPIMPEDFERDWAQLRESWGFLPPKQYANVDTAKKSLVPWPEDQPRHTNISIWCQLQELAKVGALKNEMPQLKPAAEQHGNSDAIIGKHYRGEDKTGRLVTAQDAREYHWLPQKYRDLLVKELSEAVAKGIPGPIRTQELINMDCPPTAEALQMEDSKFEERRVGFLAEHPEAKEEATKGSWNQRSWEARSESNTGAWKARKRLEHRMKTGEVDLFREIWIKNPEGAAAALKVSAFTIEALAQEHQIPMPPNGYWKAVMCGGRVTVPKVVADHFQLEELERSLARLKYENLDWGRVHAAKAKYGKMPGVREFFRLIWDKTLEQIGTDHLNGAPPCIVRNQMIRLGMDGDLRPRPSYWKTKVIPEDQKHVKEWLALSEDDLKDRLVERTKDRIRIAPAQPTAAATQVASAARPRSGAGGTSAPAGANPSSAPNAPAPPAA